MKLIPQISFHNVEETEAIANSILEKLERIDRLYPRITSCRVLVDAPHQHHHKGKLFRVRIDLMIPGKEIVVNRDPAQHDAHKDLYVAIRDAFSSAERLLVESVRTQRGHVKYHEKTRRVPPPVDREPEESYFAS